MLDQTFIVNVIKHGLGACGETLGYAYIYPAIVCPLDLS
jgi:hypothetical protein